MTSLLTHAPETHDSDETKEQNLTSSQNKFLSNQIDKHRGNVSIFITTFMLTKWIILRA